MPGELSPEDKVDLFRDLKSADEKRRGYAIKTLAKNVSAQDVEVFIHKLKPFEWEGRLNAVKLLEKIDGAAAVEKLKNLLLDASPKVREAARKSLKKLGIDQPYSNDEVLELVDCLAHPSWWVKLQAIKSLAHIRDPRAEAPISHLLVDEDEQVRDAAREALEVLKKPKK